jgi:hypothetical protein
MADIKFMDLAENNNPALTDSILSGNTDSGITRITLETLQNAIVPKLAKPLLKIESTAINAADFTSAGFANVTARVIAGYTFLCWQSVIGVNTSLHPGWSAPDQATTQVWFTNPETDYSTLQSEISSEKNPWFQIYAIYVSDTVMK